MKSLPKISIIMPTLNSGKYFSQSLESLKGQNYPNLESIVVDGGSNDDTIDIAKEYNVDFIKVIDGCGLYKAINEGIRLSSGEIIGILNSDDLLNDVALLKVAQYFNENDIDILCGMAERFYLDIKKNKFVEKEYESNGKTMEFETLLNGVPLINAHYFKSKVFKNIGMFDTSLKISADRAFMIEAKIANINYKYCAEILYKYRIHEDSLTLNKSSVNSHIIGLEHIKIAKHLVQRENVGADAWRIKQWILSSSVTAIIGLLKINHTKQALQIFMERWRENSVWPIHFFKIIMAKLFNRMKIVFS